MKRIIWFAMALIVTGSICGCGGKEKPSSNATSQADAQQTAPMSGGLAAAVKASTPKEAVTEFLDALRAGDKTTTETLLTAKAREETAAHDLVVQPPGAPSASYSIGQVQHVEGDDTSAYVSCVWSENEDDAEFEVVWILRQEDIGWRIAGMATQLPDSDEPVILNFEDLSELEDAMREAEVAERQSETSPNNEQNTAIR